MQNEDVVAPIGCSECVTEIVSHRRGNVWGAGHQEEHFLFVVVSDHKNVTHVIKFPRAALEPILMPQQREDNHSKNEVDEKDAQSARHSMWSENRGRRASSG